MLLAELMCKKQIVHVLGHTVLLPVVLMQWHDGVSIAALFSLMMALFYAKQNSYSTDETASQAC